MVVFLDAIAETLNCSRNAVATRLNHPLDRERIIKLYKGVKLRTTYNDHIGSKRTFHLEDITKRPATDLLAYGDLGKIWNCSVPQHFFSRHRIRIKFPFHPCVIEKTKYHRRRGTTRTVRFYPLELVEILKDYEAKTEEENETVINGWGDDAVIKENEFSTEDEITEEELKMTRSVTTDELGKISRQMRKRLGKHLFEEVPPKKADKVDSDLSDGYEEENCTFCGEGLIDGRHWPPLDSRGPALSLGSFVVDDDAEMGEEQSTSTSSNFELYSK